MTVAVFDTNVMVSGILSPTGGPGRILEAIRDGFCRPAVTDSILAEYEEVLSRPKSRFPPAKIRPHAESAIKGELQRAGIAGLIGGGGRVYGAAALRESNGVLAVTC